MSKQTLTASLERLRAELAASADLDADTRQQLADVADTIDQLLEEESPDYRAAHSSIEDAALSFESRHPAFSRILSDVTYSLAKLGF
jgi:hypothetical protein